MRYILQAQLIHKFTGEVTGKTVMDDSSGAQWD